MRLVLAYNDYDGISGESVFFRNMIETMGKRGIETIPLPVRQAEPGTFMGLPSHYLRFPLLSDTKKALKGIGACDIIHFLNSPLCPAGSVIKGPKKIASAHFFVESYLSSTTSGNPAMGLAEKGYAAYASMLDRNAFRSLDRLVACSPHLAAVIKTAYGIGNVDVIYPGIDTGYFKDIGRIDLKTRFDCDEAIVFLGRLHERSKGVSDLIRAVRIMDRKGAKLIIVGDGPDRKGYEMLARRIGVQDRVVFTGNLDFKEKSAIQKSADLVAMPSRYEVYGTVFAESMACGVPVVAYDLPFWKGMYDGAGLFVPPSGPRSLADGMMRVLDEPRLRKDIISKGAELTPEHSFEKTADAYCTLYRKLASKGVDRV
jgi:glycosyltransferase involved in cell wall biosynthesis